MIPSTKRSLLSKLCLGFFSLWVHILICQNKVQVIASETTTTTTTTSSSSSPTGTIQGRILLPESMIQTNPPLPTLNTTLITLNDGEYKTYTKAKDGSFTFHNIPPGIHVLDVQSNYYHFSQIKIQLLPDNTNNNNNNNMMEPNCIEYVFPGATKYAIPHPLNVYAHATFDYFEQRPSFSPFRILKNPMVLMMIVSVGFMVIMPWMMDGLDDEQKEQMKKQMEMQQDPSKMLSQMWGELSGKGPDDNVRKVSKKGNKNRLKRE